MKKKIFIGIIIIIIFAFGFLKVFPKKSSPYVVEKVKRGEISQEVSVTGEVEKGENISLSFQRPGIIKKIYVKEGEKIKAGQALASLDTSDLQWQLDSAKNNLELAKANYQKIIKGTDPERIKIAELEYKNAQEGVKISQNNLNNSLKKIPFVISNAFSISQSAYNLVESIFKVHFKIYTNFVWSDRYQDALTVEKERDEIELARDSLRALVNSSQKESLTKTTEVLETVKDDLKNLELISSQDKYFNEFSPEEKASLIETEQNANSLWENAMELKSNLDSLENSLKIAKRKEEIAKENLSLLKSLPHKEDVELYQAKIKQAKSQISLLENQIEEAKIKSPLDGEVLKINYKEGEYVSSFSNLPFAEIISGDSYYIKANVPESDITKLSLGNKCKITLDAFPETEFSGEIIEIKSAPKVIGGVVYYEIKTTIKGDEKKIKKLKTGMTADVNIIPVRKENVIVIPERAIIFKNGKKFVRVLQGGKVREKEIKTGIKGSEGEIEVISGLKEGEELITFEKKR